MNKWIRWTQSDGLERGLLTGQMPEENLNNALSEFKKEAEEYLKISGAEHVVYATKEHAEDGTLTDVRFYTRVAKTDEELKNLTDLINGEILAVHRRDI
jgi:hypothetical protein